jgi:hypothetical protein
VIFYPEHTTMDTNQIKETAKHPAGSFQAAAARRTN